MDIYLDRAFGKRIWSGQDRRHNRGNMGFVACHSMELGASCMVDYRHVRFKHSHKNSHGLCICVRRKKLIYGTDFSYDDKRFYGAISQWRVTHEYMAVQHMDGGHITGIDIFNQKEINCFRILTTILPQKTVQIVEVIHSLDTRMIHIEMI